jgi:hypothetical protein
MEAEDAVDLIRRQRRADWVGIRNLSPSASAGHSVTSPARLSVEMLRPRREMRRWWCCCRDRSGHSSSASRSGCASAAIASSRSISTSATLGSRAGSSAFLFRDTSEQWQIWFRTFPRRPQTQMRRAVRRSAHLSSSRHRGVQGVTTSMSGASRKATSGPTTSPSRGGGNSAASALATSWDDGKARELKLPTPIDGQRFPRHGQGRRALLRRQYALLRRHIDNYTHHRVRPLLTEGFFWLRNAYRKWRRRIEERPCGRSNCLSATTTSSSSQRFRSTTISASRRMAADGRTSG